MTDLSIETGREELLAYGWVPVERINPSTGKREVKVNKGKNGRHYRVVRNAQGIVRNSVLPEDAWKGLEDAVIQEATLPTLGVQHLRDAGLVTRSDIADTMWQYDVFSEVTAANITVDGEGSDDRDLPQTERKSITVPIVSKSFSQGFRALAAFNRTPGRDFSTESATAMTRVVVEALENALFNGYAVQLSSTSIAYGYTNNPDRNTEASSGAWTTIGVAEGDVSTAIDNAAGDNYFGPFNVYVAQTEYNAISKLYKSVDNNVTELDRILNYPQVAGVFPIADTFLSNAAVLVQMDRTVIQWIEAMPIRLIEWQSPDGMTTHWRIMTIAAPRTASTWADRSGISEITAID